MRPILVPKIGQEGLDHSRSLDTIPLPPVISLIGYSLLTQCAIVLCTHQLRLKTQERPTMPPTVLEMTKDLVVAQIQNDNMSPEDVHESTRQIFESMLALKSREESGAPAVDTPQVPVDWRTSISRHVITCLECGQTFKQLSVRHLRRHDLDGRSYRNKYGIPKTQPLAARATTALRRQIAAEIRPWEKSPVYVKAQAKKAAAAKKAGRKKAVRRQ